MGKKVFSFLKLAPLVSAATALIISLSGCGVSGLFGSGVTVNGRASLGPVEGALVELRCADAAEDEAPLGTGETDESGNFKIKLDSKPDCAVVATITGGSYKEEATGATVSLEGKVLHGIVPKFDSDEESFAITALTEIAYQRFEELASHYDDLSEEDLANFAELANDEVGASAGVNFKIAQTLPADPKNPESDKDSFANLYALVNAGLSVLATSLGKYSYDMAVGVGSFGADFTNGSFGSGSSWSTLDDKINTWLGSSANSGGFVPPSTGLMAPPTLVPDMDFTQYELPDTAPHTALPGIPSNQYSTPTGAGVASIPPMNGV